MAQPNVRGAIRRRSRRERFLKLGPTRTQKVIDALEALGRCGDPANHEYADSEVRKIFETIYSELQRTRDRFGKKSDTVFKL